jgi:hypothetical protein
MPSDEARGVIASRRRWGAGVLVSVLVPLLLWRLATPLEIVIAVALLVMLIALGDLILGESLERRDQVRARLDQRDRRRLEVVISELLDQPTHDPFREAASSLDAVAAAPGLTADERSVLLRTRGLLERIAHAIRETRPVRDAVREQCRRRPALRLEQLADDDPQTGVPMIRYADPSNLPDWVPSPAVGPLTRVGGVLDDVRRLHNAQIEAAVLLLTLWARLLIVAFAPLLGGITPGPVPLQDGVTLRDAPFLAAVACCAVTALVAPWLVREVMRRDARGARVRRWLLVVEVPLAIAATVAWPCWPVGTFAAGWTNWWQRPVFNWAKLVLWGAAVAACLVAGAALAGDLDGGVAVDVAITFAVVLVIGDSYGAMLPISVSVLLRVVVGGLLFPRRARRAADEQLSRAIADLHEAARITERSAPGDVRGAGDDAQRLREIADELAVTSRRDDRWARGTPLEFPALLDAALTRRAPRSGSPEATLALAKARDLGRPLPLTVDEPSFDGDIARSLRVGDKRHAKVLAQVLDVLTREAVTHGSGPMIVVCLVEREAVVLRLANARREPPAERGTGLGASELETLRRRLPGATMPVRHDVAGTFVDLLASQRRFGVELRLPLTLFIVLGNR